jgi:hypothetical protein
VQAKRTHLFFFVLLSAFFPLVWFAFVSGGFLPLGLILLMTVREPSLALLNAIHLAVYFFPLYWLSAGLARLIIRYAPRHTRSATALLALAITTLALLPIFGVGHGPGKRTNAFELYASVIRFR